MLLCDSFNRVEASISCEVCEASGEMKEPLKQCVAWLQAYFTEPQLMLKLPVPPFHHHLLEQASFTRDVLWTLMRDVKFGEAVSYKQLAAMAGHSKAVRAVGGAMRRNPVRECCRCERVLWEIGAIWTLTGTTGAKQSHLPAFKDTGSGFPKHWNRT
uniref:Methylated-DNA--protein-cysteine methyltransferase n=1 Tax=Laticauda laticaudata TaxID=8630 RepID=A0A8C5WY53_LATLA